jgi:UV DNA damage endonuclease
MTVSLGYACINQTLAEQKISCNRGIIKRTFQSRGAGYAADLALHNVKSLLKIIQWNAENSVYVYRMTSCLFPWMSEYEFGDLHNFSEIADMLDRAGRFAMSTGQRLSFHPGQFCVLASPTDSVVDATITELNKHAEIMDWMGLPDTPESKINIHVGGAYGDRDAAMVRFCKSFQRLGTTTRSRLTVENDDKPSMYSVKMLYDGIYQRINIPIVFDSHHFSLGPQDQSYRDAFYLARSTWEDIKQICHHSNSRKLYDDPTARALAHSDYLHTPFENFGEPVDVVLECKAKEQALLKYRKDFE